MFWTRIAILFVPFATEDSRPRKIKVGSVNVEPPPAITLRKPAMIPRKKRMIRD